MSNETHMHGNLCVHYRNSKIKIRKCCSCFWAEQLQIVSLPSMILVQQKTQTLLNPIHFVDQWAKITYFSLTMNIEYPDNMTKSRQNNTFLIILVHNISLWTLNYDFFLHQASASSLIIPTLLCVYVHHSLCPLYHSNTVLVAKVERTPRNTSVLDLAKVER